MCIGKFTVLTGRSSGTKAYLNGVQGACFCSVLVMDNVFVRSLTTLTSLNGVLSPYRANSRQPGNTCR